MTQTRLSKRLRDFAKPASPANEHGVKAPAGIQSLSFDFELVTPMYGGGARRTGLSAGPQYDAHSLIRAAGIRAQLRQWWRMMEFESDPNERREREFKIFGGTSRAQKPIASQVRLRVTVTKTVLRRIQFDTVGQRVVRHKDDRSLDYADFPLDSTVTESGSYDQLGAGTCFRLHLDVPADLVEEICCVLRMFANLGSIGGRTRRGFGAVYCQELAVEDGRALDELMRKVSAGVVRYHASPLNHIEAVKKLREFRQGPGFARVMKNPPGESFWPEAASVRGIANSKGPISYFHRFKTDTLLPNGKYKEVWKFKADDVHQRLDPSQAMVPRAQFGLPIVMKFVNELVRTGKGEPSLKPDTQLTATINNQAGRYASPLLIRPIRWKFGNSSQHATVALRVRQAGPGKLTIAWKSGTVAGEGDASLGMSNAAKWQKQTWEQAANGGLPMCMNGRIFDDVIDAFFHFLTRGS